MQVIGKLNVDTTQKDVALNLQLVLGQLTDGETSRSSVNHR